jgi:hypothetical protein
MFHKGLLPRNAAASYDKVLITTLFTFDFDICLEAIRYYVAIVGIENVFVGGIAATIMPERFLREIPKLQILCGQLTSSTKLGYNDNVNIDILELDYDILWDIPYTYPASDSYFIYTTRGCPRKCSFCAVKSLEPTFLECSFIQEQITRVDSRFGLKKQLLIMDNNILYSQCLSDNIETLVALGFGNENNVIKKNCNMSYYLSSLWERQRINKQYNHLLNRIKNDFLELNNTRISAADKENLTPAIEYVVSNDDASFINYLIEQHKYVVDFFERYNYHKIKRFVDFNQGLDARLLTEEKARLLSRLAVKPCRIAFDDLKTRDDYFRALDTAVDNGIFHFSNYILFNYDDPPKDLWTRLFLNVEYCQNRKEVLSLFSFPMKYASIEHTDRNFVGQYWNRKYLKSVNVILNVTKGVVAKEKDFFIRAFGRSEDEFIEILTMPDDFIRYRDYFEANGFIQKWLHLYRTLTAIEKQELLDILTSITTESDAPDIFHSTGLHDIIQMYSLKKSKMEKNKLYYFRLFGLGVSNA